VGQVGAGLVIAIEGGDLVVVGAGQLVLRGDDFDVVGDAGLEAVARLFDFLLGEVHPRLATSLPLRADCELGRGGLHLERDAVAEFLLLLASWRMARSALARAAWMRPPVNSGISMVGPVCVDRDGAGGSESLLQPEAVEGDLGQALLVGCLELRAGALFFG
jgi:hypothetical protein